MKRENLIKLMEVVNEERSHKELYTKATKFNCFPQEYKWVNKIKKWLLDEGYMRINSERICVLSPFGKQYLKMLQNGLQLNN